MKSLSKKKGFTLIEVLIVVVIIGILAALILPRMTAQTDKAKAAEPMQMLGTISRAQMAWADANTTYTAASCTVASGAGGSWTNLGMGSCAGGQFDYHCVGTPPTTCLAVPPGTAPATATDKITITLATATAAPVLACAGKYDPAC